jgi:hypothetical protein
MLKLEQQINSKSMNQSLIVPVQLENSTIIRVQATVVGNSSASSLTEEEIETDVALNIRPLKEVADAIVGVAETMKAAFDQVKPSKASVEFGLEFGYESGQLTALIVQGTGKANLKISLEWNKS